MHAIHPKEIACQVHTSQGEYLVSGYLFLNHGVDAPWKVLNFSTTNEGQLRAVMLRA